MKWKSTLINGDKGQKNCSQKCLNHIIGKKRNERAWRAWRNEKRCCGQSAYVGYVGLVGKTLKVWKLRWNGCSVAKKRTKNEYFVNQTKDRTNDRTKNDYFVNQTKDRMGLQTHKISKCNVLTSQLNEVEIL